MSFFPGSGSFRIIFRKPAANIRKYSNSWNFTPVWGSKFWVTGHTFFISFCFCTYGVLCIAKGSSISWEARTTWVPILHEDWRLQVWCSVQVSSSKRESHSCSRLCLEFNWTSSTSSELSFTSFYILISYISH